MVVYVVKRPMFTPIDFRPMFQDWDTCPSFFHVVKRPMFTPMDFRAMF